MNAPTVKFFFILFITSALFINAKGQTFYPELQEFNNNIAHNLKSERIQLLDSIATIIYNDWLADKRSSLLFVCTHNSRRSHLAQLWFQVASYYYGLPNINTFSGGTTATSVSDKAIEALKRVGMRFESEEKVKNPKHKVFFGEKFPEIEIFSKQYSDTVNPSQDFIAIMVCSEADKSCPVVPGAEYRISLPYDDPRYSDNLASEQYTYDKTTRLIATEMFYIVELVKKKLVYFDEGKKKSN